MSPKIWGSPIPGRLQKSQYDLRFVDHARKFDGLTRKWVELTWRMRQENGGWDGTHYVVGVLVVHSVLNTARVNLQLGHKPAV
ncbi:MAG: hypothetical protein QXP58_02385 [Thermoprotei archaeon]